MGINIMCKTRLWSALFCVTYAMATLAMAAPPRQPLFHTLDIDRGEAQEIQLANGKTVKVKLLEVQDQRDSLRQAIRRSTIKIEINGTAATLVSGTCHLPITSVEGIGTDGAK